MSIRVRDLTLRYTRPWPAQGPARLALDAVNLTIEQGEVFGLVGESGSGKSSLARVLLRLIAPGEGQVEVAGIDPFTLDAKALLNWRRRVQPVFQDSVAALNPRLRIRDSLREGLDIHRIGPAGKRNKAVEALLDAVGLEPDHGTRLPHQLSGGQRQRVAIARALALEPEVLIADEPVSALDLSVQAQILTLMTNLCRARGMTLLFISHDLGVIEQIAPRVGVMKEGRLLEIGETRRVFATAQHPYTRALVAAAPRVNFDDLRLRAKVEIGPQRNQPE